MNALPNIANLDGLGLSAAAVASRAFTIGGSDANIIAGGDADAINKLWQVKTGRVEPEDLSDVLHVVMGNWTEPLNAAWYEKQTQNLIEERDIARTCDRFPWRTATLDGITMLQGRSAVWEAKHVNPFKKPDEIVEKYLPQLHHNMDVVGLDVAVLSVLRGNMEWFQRVIEFDPAYASDLLEAEEAFYQAMIDDTPPVEIPAPAKAIDPGEMRTVNMTGNNEWAVHAGAYADNAQAKKAFDAAAKGLRAMIEADVKEAAGHGIAAKRSKSGAIIFSISA